jgi:hypothetical protein
MSERRQEQEQDKDPTRLTTGEPGTPAERWLRLAFTDAAELTARGGSVPTRSSRRAPHFSHRRSLQVALAVGVVLLAGATFAAFRRFVRPRLAARTVTTSAPTERASVRRAQAPAPVARAVSVAETDAVPLPDESAPGAIPIERPRRALRRVVPSEASSAPLPQPVSPAPAAHAVVVLSVPRPHWPLDDALPAPRPPAPADEQNPSEAHVLAGAISHLRGGHEATAALDDLADYERRFPSGLLDREVLRIRIEALLDLARDREALKRLDDRAPDALTRPLLLLRGELRARAGRCDEALRDLDPLADEGQTPAVLAGRALYARASCHSQLGDVAAARDDLERYQARFPDGSFHADAAAFLRATTP